MNEEEQLNTTQQIPVLVDSSKSSNWLLIGGGLLIIVALLAVVGYFFFENQKLREMVPTQPKIVPTNLQVSESPKNNPASNSGDFTQVSSFTTVLMKDCIESQIQADKLPFNLVSLTQKYQHNGPHFCSTTSSYISLSGGPRPDFQANNLYVFHGGSSYEGYGNPFRELVTYTQVNSNNQKYGFDVMQPGPYGISDLGLLITVVGQFELSNSNLIVRSTRLINFEDEEALNLIRQYGEKVEDLGEGSPQYIVHDPRKVSQLENAIIKEIETPGTNFNQVFSAAAADIEDDFKQISPDL